MDWNDSGTPQRGVREPRPALNDTQFALFGEDHPAMRQRGPAEFTPQEFREKPGAWFHGTFAPSMPREGLTPQAAGIHLGTLNAAKERLDTMGPRKVSEETPGGREVDPSAPAQIHARRLAPGAGPGSRSLPMMGSMDNPKEDLGGDWRVREDPYNWEHTRDREAHTFGEYYRNDTEDQGSVSIRVPDHGYLHTHRDSVNRAIRSNQPVHPLTAGLIRDFGGRGLDEPEPYKPLSRDVNYDVGKFEQVDHDTLLPYRLRANIHQTGFKSETFKHLNGDQFKAPAVTFAATEQEAHEKIDTGNWTQRWSY